MRKEPPAPIREGDYWLIPLSQGMFAKVSDCDVARVSQFKWYASLESRGTKYYAVRWVTVDGKREKIRMHHFVLSITPRDLPEGHIVDHDNEESLDNRDWNLKVITQVANMLKSQGWKKKGVKCEPFL